MVFFHNHGKEDVLVTFAWVCLQFCPLNADPILSQLFAMSEAILVLVSLLPEVIDRKVVLYQDFFPYFFEPRP